MAIFFGSTLIRGSRTRDSRLRVDLRVKPYKILLNLPQEFEAAKELGLGDLIEEDNRHLLVGDSESRAMILADYITRRGRQRAEATLKEWREDQKTELPPVNPEWLKAIEEAR